MWRRWPVDMCSMMACPPTPVGPVAIAGYRAMMGRMVC
jgi:hypothetical protein